VISILDIFEKNPYSRIYNSSYKTIDILRKEIAIECSRTDRFRRE
jgi:cytosolic carboxypeptidase protein 5